MFTLRAVVSAIGAIGLLAGVMASRPARADVIFSGTGTDSDGAPLAATVDFSLTGSTFQIVLTNLAKAKSPASVLTNLAVTTAPTPATALPSSAGTIQLSPGSTFVYSGNPGTQYTLGQEWAYLSGGVASSGFGVGTGHGNLCGSTICNGQALSGAAYGLIGTGTVLGNNLKNNYYVDNSVTIDITLASLSSFSLADITDVQFQYGTSPGEGSITVDSCTGGSDCTIVTPPNNQNVPEPSSLALLGFGLAALGLYRRRRA